jgi:pimeloyl-ACP methyl ester carboxylesterase
MKYDVLEKVERLTMPVLLIVGESDTGTPPAHHWILFDALPGKKELHAIKGAGHTPREEAHLEELKRILSHWIENIDGDIAEN